MTDNVSSVNRVTRYAWTSQYLSSDWAQNCNKPSDLDHLFDADDPIFLIRLEMQNKCFVRI